MSEHCNLHDIVVLAVDDIEDNLDLIEAYLEDQVWSVARAGSGDEALQAATALQPDILLLDLMMPRMNGLAVLRAIRSITALSHLGVIVQTAYADRKNILLARRMGCTHFLCKPLDRGRLLEELQACADALSYRPLPRKARQQTEQAPAEVATALQRAAEGWSEGGGDAELFAGLRELVADDSAVGRELVRKANSSAYAGRYRARTVSEAIVRLGANATREIIHRATREAPSVLSQRNADDAVRALRVLTDKYPERTASTAETLSLLQELGAQNVFELLGTDLESEKKSVAAGDHPR